MSNPVIVDKLPLFSNRLSSVMDDAIKEGARDALINAKTKAPYQKGGGGLRSNTETKQIKNMHWRVSFWEEYARFQEFGGDAKRQVRKYTTAGTGKRFLKNAGDEQARNIVSKFRKHGSRVKV